MTQARLGQKLGSLAAGLFLASLAAGCSQAPLSGGSDYWVTHAYIPPNEVWMPPDPAPLPLPGSRVLVPGGGGTLMEIGGDSPRFMAPAGGGTFMEMP